MNPRGSLVNHQVIQNPDIELYELYESNGLKFLNKYKIEGNLSITELIVNIKNRLHNISFDHLSIITPTCRYVDLNQTGYLDSDDDKFMLDAKVGLARSVSEENQKK